MFAENYVPGWEEKAPDDPLKNQWKELAFGTLKERDSIGLILLNSFYDGKDYVFYDQEMYVENLPAKYIMHRTITMIYMGKWELDRVLPEKKLRDCYGLNQCRQLFGKFAINF